MSLMEVLKRRLGNGPQQVNDRDLADLGVIRLDFAVLARCSPKTRTRMATMADHLGVSLDVLQKDTALATIMSQTCSGCRAARTCDRASEGIGRLDKVTCPNAARFEDMRSA